MLGGSVASVLLATSSSTRAPSYFNAPLSIDKMRLPAALSLTSPLQAPNTAGSTVKELRSSVKSTRPLRAAAPIQAQKPSPTWLRSALRTLSSPSKQLGRTSSSARSRSATTPIFAQLERRSASEAAASGRPLPATPLALPAPRPLLLAVPSRAAAGAAGRSPGLPPAAPA